MAEEGLESGPGPPDAKVEAEQPSASLGPGGDSCEAGDMCAGQEDGSDCGNTQQNPRKKGIPWTEDEHRLFLLGLQKLGKGDWRGISRHYVTTRTPTQVASHAQKHFIRQQTLSKRKRRSSLFDIVNEGGAPESGGGSGSGKAGSAVGSMPLPPYPQTMAQQGNPFMPGGGMSGMPPYGFGNPVHLQQQQAAAAHAAAAAGWNPAMGQAQFMPPHAAHQFSGYLQMAHQHQQNFAQQQAAAAGMFFAHQQQQAVAYAAWMQQMQQQHPGFVFPPNAMMGMLPPYQQHRFPQLPQPSGSGPAPLPSVPSVPSIASLPTTPRGASGADASQGQLPGTPQAASGADPKPNKQLAVLPGTGGSAFSPAVPSAQQKSTPLGGGSGGGGGHPQAGAMGSVHGSNPCNIHGSAHGSNRGASGSDEWTAVQLGVSAGAPAEAATPRSGSATLDADAGGSAQLQPQASGDFGHGKLFRPTASRAQPAQKLSSLPLFGAADADRGPVAPHNAPHGVKRHHSDDASSGGDGSGRNGSGGNGSCDGNTKNSDKSSGKSSDEHWQLNGSESKSAVQPRPAHEGIPKPPAFRSAEGTSADPVSPKTIGHHADGSGTAFRPPAKAMKTPKQ